MHYLLRMFFGPKVKIGQVWELDYSDSPFDRTIYFEVTDVKDGWVQYEGQNWKHKNSKTIRMFRACYRLVKDENRKINT